MKKLELLNLTLENFKGIKHFDLSADGNNIDLYGDNGTGKTTLFDGFVYLLFGKDSQNKSDFEIKTLDENGNVKQHGLEHSVEGVFRFEEKTFSLKRVYAEKWTKKRGSSKQVFSGHTTSYFIDGVPKKQKEFNEMVDSIIPEDVFKLLTNPLYFNEKLDWKKRREIVLEIAGNVTDEEIIQANENLASVISKLEGKDIEDLKAVIRMKMKKINDELDKIPVRIDEIQLSMEDVNQDKDVLENDKSVLIEKIDQAKEVIENIKSGAEINRKRKRISEIELEISQLENEYQKNSMNEMFELKSMIHQKQSDIHLLESKMENEYNRIQANDKQIDMLDKRVNELRMAWIEVDDEQFNHEDNCLCPTCKQDLPEDQIKEAIENFNENKAKKLEQIVSNGNEINQQIAGFKMKNEQLQEEIEKMNGLIEKLNLEIDECNGKYEQLKNNAKSIHDNDEYLSKVKEKEALQSDITALMESENKAVEEQKQIIIDLEKRKAEIEQDISKIAFVEKSKVRISELEAEEEKLSIEYEQLEAEMFAIEEYTRTKINLLESKINSQFKYARFRLFEEQINGGLKETCETIYKGVPYSRGLNNASRINIGLDIINSLNKHYGISAPIFIDNSESVTKLIETESQMIRLVVSEKHKQLSTKPENQTEKTA